MRSKRRRSLGLVMFLMIGPFFNSISCAQSAGALESTSKNSGSLKRNLATVVLAGLGGAVLGLSTLSFYNNPQEKIANITTGFAVGLLAGGIYVLSVGNSDRQRMEIRDDISSSFQDRSLRLNPVEEFRKLHPAGAGNQVASRGAGIFVPLWASTHRF